ncbi:hypothetical protein PVAP13_5KG408100 [Panicum virgatum]|uniref:RING-CH-type domain-containing protein n=1 Tax=Panicum virgatum TaxID=38727 RepID=A0A8T0SKJ1_PANVG|nr:hypothetical protein PVAP13_5KG408100 [Panicum virgatum]
MPPAAAGDGALPEAATTGKDDDVEASPAACCRICLQPDCARGDELISPCRCKGTQQFVHRTCLDHWRAVKEGTAFSHCTTCKAQFHLRVEFLEDDMCRRMKFRLFVARDVFLVFLAIQAVIGTIAGVAYLLDRDGKFRNRFADSGDHLLSKHPVLFYYCVGVVVFFALIGLCGLLLHCFSSDNTDPTCLGGCSYECVECFAASGEASCLVLAVVVVVVFAIPGVIYGCIAATLAFQNIMQRHYHILHKMELTKARDLQGDYAPPPKMDPKHEQRLKMLQLV